MTWQEQLIRRLLDAGSDGLRQNQLYFNEASAEDVFLFLESLRAQGAVQRFTVPWGYYWRATDKLPDLV